MEVEFKAQSFGKKLKSMIAVDFRRMLTTPLFYIMVGISFVIPILILVMTGMMDGTTTIDPNTGVETTIEGFSNVWQSIGSVSGAEMSMDLTGMCNINLIYFILAVFVCLFVSADFRSGYAKNLFTTRAKKTDYVISKTLTGFVCGAVMLMFFFIGAMIGGSMAGLSFDTGAAGVGGIVCCMVSKIFLAALFVSIFVVMSVLAKQKTWLGIICSLAASMLLFTMVPMISPLNSGAMNVILCLVGGAIFSVGLGAVSRLILNKTNLIL